jgi:hypothetical protein
MIAAVLFAGREPELSEFLPRSSGKDEAVSDIHVILCHFCE